MQTFAEQLTAARKAKGMTQDQLAQAAAVTRQTISSWERGRTLPDIASVRRMSELLGVDLMQAAEEGQGAVPVVQPQIVPEGSDAPVPESGESALEDDESALDGDEPTQDSGDPTSNAARRRKTPWIIAGAALLACAVCAVLLLTTRKPAQQPQGDENAFDAQFYEQQTPNEAGKAYFTFDNQTWEEKSDSTDYQRYDFVMREQNGVGFSVTRVEAALEGVNGNVRTATLDVDALKAACLETEIPAYGTFHIDGGFPLGEFLQAGIVVYGNDANGAALTFHSLIVF